VFGWAALVPFFLAAALAARGAGAARRAFLAGVLTGVVYFVGTVYWVAATMAVYGGLARPVALAVTALLVLYLAVYPGLAAAILARSVRAWGPRALLAGPLVWTATEFARAQLFTGFPWVLLGYSQATVPSVLQVSSLGGIYAVSALVALPAAAVAYAAVAVDRRAVRALAVAVGIVAACAAWGHWRVARGTLLRAGTPLRAAVVQGNVPQDVKWDRTHAARILETYLALTRDAGRRGAALIVWPETSTPFAYGASAAGRATLADLARETGAALLVGSDEAVAASPPRYYNAAYLIGPDGETAGAYRKMHLVPFGEYVPLASLLFFVGPLVESVSSFSAGEELSTFPVAGHSVTTAICYESVFPEIARAAVAEGSALLTTITNDAWYGRSSAPFQHFEQAAVRAVEQGRFLLRAANTGISAVVDPYGRPVVRSGLFVEAALVADVRLLTHRTTYATIGDSFAWASVLLSGVLWVSPRRRAGRPAQGAARDTQP
jgi:apolipoprotein N-acyltransferase